MIEHSTRRTALSLFVQELGLLLVAQACLASGGNEQITKNSPVPLSARDKLVEYVDKLPPSLVKDGLTTRIVSYFNTNLPSAFQRGPLNLKVIASEITESTQNVNKVNGTSSIRGGAKVPPPPVRTVQRVEFDFALVGLFDPTENQKFPEVVFYPDSTPTTHRTYQQGTLFYEGVGPQIRVITPASNFTYPSKTTDEKWAYIKEASTLLVVDTWLEEVAKKMLELKQPFYIPATDTQDQIVSAEMITQTLFELQRGRGRIVAAIDLAGYLLGFKAFENTPDASVLGKYDPRIQAAASSAMRVDLGRTNQDMLLRSLRWAITDQSARNLVHNGDLNKL